MHKLWGSPPTTASDSINISMLGESSTQYQNSVGLTLYGSTAGKNAVMDNVQMNLLGSPTNPVYTESMNISLLTNSRGSLSEVMPMTILGQYFKAPTKTINMIIYAIPDDIGGSCLVSEGVDQFEILVEGTNQCLSISNMLKSNVNMSILCEGTGLIQDNMNLTMRYNPTNVVNMSMRVQGTRIFNTASFGTEDGSDEFILQNGDDLVTFDPIIMTIKGGNNITDTMFISMPTSHSQDTKPVTLCTRGF